MGSRTDIQYVGRAAEQVIELAQTGNATELECTHPNSIFKAVVSHWSRRRSAPTIIPTLLRLGSKNTDWHMYIQCKHFGVRVSNAYQDRWAAAGLPSQDSTDTPADMVDDGELKETHEAIAYEIVSTFPNLLRYRDEKESGRTVVHHCAVWGSVSLFLKLLALARLHGHMAAFRATDQNRNTPLYLALSRARDGHNIEIVKTLLEHTDVEIDGPSWRYAAGLGQDNTFKAAYEDAVQLFMTYRPASINDALIKCAMQHERLLGTLLELDNSHTWHDKLLFLAVEIRSMKAVEGLLKRFPSLAIARKDGKSVLEFLSETAHDLETRKSMRAFIAPHIIRQVEEEARCPVQIPESAVSTSSSSVEVDFEADEAALATSLSSAEKIRALLADNPADRKEISLDLAGFKQSKLSIEHLLSLVDVDDEAEKQAVKGKPQVPRPEPTLTVNFESTLSFVDIPVPTLPQAKAAKETASGVLMRDEVCRILTWLHRKKRVTGIYELRVRDSLFVPHCEEAIKTCVEKFDIEVLDWTRPDLSLEPLKESCRNLKELTLYASSWSSLHYWTSAEAMSTFCGSFPKIRWVTIVIVEDLVGKQLSKAYQSDANKRLDDLLAATAHPADGDGDDIHDDGNRNSDDHGDITGNRDVFQVEIRPWPRLEVPGDSGRSVTQTTAAEATRLTEFLAKYRLLQRSFRDKDWRDDLGMRASLKQIPYTKVAIIDTGVDPGSIQCTRIHGASFIPSGTGGGESPWWFSQYPHGTQVAKIITELDPFCELLVAKVGDAHSDMTTARVVEAFRWAIECRADVISMSATIKKTRALQDAVEDAIEARIVVLGSTAGEGYADEEAWPAQFASVLSIGAAKLTGKETEESVRDHAKYMFPGKDILVSTSFLGSPTVTSEVSGTSFATAIAAGVASLVLACRRLAQSRQPDPTKKWDTDMRYRRKIVEDVFNTMSANRGRYVKPWTVFSQDPGLPSWGEDESILEWVEQRFLNRNEWP